MFIGVAVYWYFNVNDCKRDFRIINCSVKGKKINFTVLPTLKLKNQCYDSK